MELLDCKMTQPQTIKTLIRFYKNPYTSEKNFSDEECDLFISNLEIPALMVEDRDNLESSLTYDECRKILGRQRDRLALGAGVIIHPVAIGICSSIVPSLNPRHTL